MRAKHESALQGQALACFNLHRKFGLPPCTTSYHTGFGQRFPTHNLCLDVIGRLPDRVWIEVMAVLARVCVFYGSFKKNKKIKICPPPIFLFRLKNRSKHNCYHSKGSFPVPQPGPVESALSCQTLEYICVYIYIHTYTVHIHTYTV